jgi:hypothetical protein
VWIGLQMQQLNLFCRNQRPQYRPLYDIKCPQKMALLMTRLAPTATRDIDDDKLITCWQFVQAWFNKVS